MFDTVECPYCEHENDMSDGLTDLPGNDNQFDHECEKCEEEFEVEVEFSPSYAGSAIEYVKCDLCSEVTRDIKVKGRIFPFPKRTEATKICETCYRRLYREELKEDNKE